MSILEDFEDLKHLCEGELPIIELGGEYYWIGEENPPSDFEIEPQEVECKPVLSIRRTINTNVTNYSNYTLEPDYKKKWNQGRFDYEDGYLPDSSIRIYKKLKVDHPDELFIVETEEGNFCIRNGCHDCKYKESCEVELIEEDLSKTGRIPYKIAVLDISAQEPQIITLASGEPRLLETFRNRHWRVTGLTKYLDVVISKSLKIDVNSINSTRYWEWIDNEFHHNVDKLVIFNEVVDTYKNGSTDLGDKITELSEELLSSFQEFVEKNPDEIIAPIFKERGFSQG